jgi:hypothetical protein
LTTGRAAGRDICIEWRTYTPDGRVLIVRRVEHGWQATCDDEEPREDEELVQALRAAVGHERGETLTLGRQAHDETERWIVEQARRIERESRA